MDDLVSRQQLTLAFPLYIITGEDGVPIIANTGEHECLLAYAIQELAELYVSQAGEMSTKHLGIIEVSVDEYRDFLMACQGDVKYFNLNTTINPKFFRLVSLAEEISRLDAST